MQKFTQHQLNTKCQPTTRRQKYTVDVDMHLIDFLFNEVDKVTVRYINFILVCSCQNIGWKGGEPK